MTDSPQCHCGFIISAGRTGTVFLSRILSRHLRNVHVAYEPFPARWELLLGNFRNECGIGADFVRRLDDYARQKRLRALSPETRYLEINPKLCPITDVLIDLPGALRVVHLVRHPLTWAESVVRCQAPRVWRHVIDFLPFATPYPSPRPRAWRRYSPEVRALWRWRFCNEQIGDLRFHADRYSVIQYERLFHSSLEIREAAIRQLLETLELPHEDVSWFQTEQCIHATPRSSTTPPPIDAAQLDGICGPLMRRFGYAVSTGE